MKIKTSFAIVIIFIVILISSMSTKAFMLEDGTITKIATPFRSIAVKLLETSHFPIFLPSYLPSLSQWNDWILKPEVNKNMFSIEMDKHYFGGRSGTGMYAGTLSGNIGNPSRSPLEDQFVRENTEVKTISLSNGIKGKEYIIDPIAGKAISWKIGQWSYFVAAQPGDGVGSTIGSASQIINIIEKNGMALSDFPGKLYFLYTGNHAYTEIYWKVNNSVWYHLVWQDAPSNAIRVLRSMKLVGDGERS